MGSKKDKKKKVEQPIDVTVTEGERRDEDTEVPDVNAFGDKSDVPQEKAPEYTPAINDSTRRDGNGDLTFDIDNWSKLTPEGKKAYADKYAAMLGASGGKNKKAVGYMAEVEASKLQFRSASELLNEFLSFRQKLKYALNPDAPALDHPDGNTVAKASKNAIGPAPEKPEETVLNDELMKMGTALTTTIAQMFASAAPSPKGNDALAGANAVKTGMNIIIGLHRDHDAHMYNMYKLYTEQFKNYNNNLAKNFETLYNASDKYNKMILRLFEQQSKNVIEQNKNIEKEREALLKAVTKESSEVGKAGKIIDTEINKGRKSWSDASRVNATNYVNMLGIKSRAAIAIMKLKQSSNQSRSLNEANDLSMAAKLNNKNELGVATNMDAIYAIRHTSLALQTDPQLFQRVSVRQNQLSQQLERESLSREDVVPLLRLEMAGIGLPISAYTKKMVDILTDEDSSGILVNTQGTITSSDPYLRHVLDGKIAIPKETDAGFAEVQAKLINTMLYLQQHPEVRTPELDSYLKELQFKFHIKATSIINRTAAGKFILNAEGN